MKIAFLEYTWQIRNGGDEMFALCWIKLLKKFGHTVDVIQYNPNLKDAYSCDASIQVKQTQDLNVMEQYDLVVVNNLYLCRDKVTMDFMIFVGSISAKTLYVNHDRPTIRQFMRGPNNVIFMHYCDAVIGYYDNLMEHIVAKEKIHKITFGHFYKPNEDAKPEHTYSRTIDMLYLARLNRVKGFNRYMEHANYMHEHSNSITSYAIYGFSGNIGQVAYKKMPEMIVDIGKEPVKNTDEAYIWFRSAISDRQQVVDILKSSRFSWNAWSFAARGKDLYHVIDNGLEAAPLEAIRYGCVPILNDIHKDLEIPISTSDMSKTMKLSEFNCAIFTNDNQSPEELKSLVEDEMTTRHKFNNCNAFKSIMDCDLLYHNTIISTFEKILDNSYCRSKAPCSKVDELFSQKELMEKGKIR